MLIGNKVRTLTKIAFIVIVGGYILDYFFFNYPKSPPDFNVELENVVREMNTKGTFDIDEKTRFDKAKAPGFRTLIYYITLKNINRADFDSVSFKSANVPSMMEVLSTRPKTKWFRDNNATIIYRLHDKEGTPLLDVTFKPQDY